MHKLLPQSAPQQPQPPPPIDSSVFSWKCCSFFLFLLLQQAGSNNRNGRGNETWLLQAKEATLESTDLTLQLLMFVTTEKDWAIYLFFFLSIFCQLCFKLGQAECVQTMKAQTKRPKSQLFIMQSLYFELHVERAKRIRRRRRRYEEEEESSLESKVSNVFFQINKISSFRERKGLRSGIKHVLKEEIETKQQQFFGWLILQGFSPLFG